MAISILWQKVSLYLAIVCLVSSVMAVIAFLANIFYVNGGFLSMVFVVLQFTFFYCKGEFSVFMIAVIFCSMAIKIFCQYQYPLNPLMNACTAFLSLCAIISCHLLISDYFCL